MASLVGTAIVLALFLLLWRFRLSDPRRGTRPTFAMALTMALFLATIGAFAYAERDALLLRAAAPPLRSFAELRATPQRPVIVEGRVSQDNPLRQGTYVAYLRFSGGAGTADFRDTPRLRVSVAGGEVALSNDDFAVRNWPMNAGPLQSFAYLERGTPVAIVGRVVRGRDLAAARDLLFIEAERVDAGGAVELVARLRDNALVPTAGMALAWFAAVFVFYRTIAAYRRLRAAGLATRG